jgi:FixJ family two-component response regulator
MLEQYAIGRQDVYHILLVDDDENYRKAHVRLLHLVHVARLNATFNVTAVDSADNAMKALQARQFDCVLLDYAMPERDGLSCLREMQLLYPDMPVILVTGAGNEKIAADAMKDGASDYLIKGSLSLEVMEKAIVNVITKAAMLRKIEEQRKQLNEAERHRVMIQTLGAACHHLGQPVTVLRTCIVMMKRTEGRAGDAEDGRDAGNAQKNAPEMHGIIMEAFEAIEKICDILFKMNHMSQFTTESYLSESPSSDTNEILKF